MTTKTVTSTQAQNNFGQVLDDITHNRTRYIITRHGIPKAILVSLDDFTQLLEDESKRQQISAIVKEVSPKYELGQTIEPTDKFD